MARSTSVDVQTALSMPMGGLSIHEDLMDQMANTLRVTLKVDDSDKLAAMGSAMIVGVAEETTPPPKAILLVLVRTWAQYFCGEKAIMAKMHVTPTKEKKKALKVGFGAPPTSDSDDDGWDVASERSGYAAGTDPESKLGQMMAADTKATGMTPAQNIAFSASVHAGFVVESELTDGMTYGSDVSLTDWARKLTKHEHKSFKSYIVSGDAEGARDHLINLLRDYNDNAMTAEATLLTMVHTVTEEMFHNDPKGKCAYYKSLLLKYRGRGFPLKEGFDLTLVVKQMKKGNESGGMSATEKTELSALKATVATLKTALNEVRSEVGSLKVAVRELKVKGGDKPEKRGEEKPCGYCGEVGHYARTCSKKKADEADKDPDKKDDE